MSNEMLHTISEKIAPILKTYGVVFAGLFGSYARGEQHAQSDVDILIRFGEPKSLLDHVRLEYSLSDVLQKKVDVVTEPSLHPLLKKNILQDLQPIYGTR